MARVAMVTTLLLRRLVPSSVATFKAPNLQYSIGLEFKLTNIVSAGSTKSHYNNFIHSYIYNFIMWNVLVNTKKRKCAL